VKTVVVGIVDSIELSGRQVWDHRQARQESFA
jgi:hypothetical protein